MSSFLSLLLKVICNGPDHYSLGNIHTHTYSYLQMNIQQYTYREIGTKNCQTVTVTPKGSFMKISPKLTLQLLEKYLVVKKYFYENHFISTKIPKAQLSFDIERSLNYFQKSKVSLQNGSVMGTFIKVFCKNNIQVIFFLV